MIFQITVGASADSNSSRELQKQVIVPEYDIPGNGRIFTPGIANDDHLTAAIPTTVSAQIERHSWLERQETHFGRT